MPRQQGRCPDPRRSNSRALTVFSPSAPAGSRLSLRLLADAVLLVACVAAAGAFSLRQGKDANWDLQNYHFYNAWAWLHGQRAYRFDIAAAQLQTYHNPLFDLPFYWMVDAGWDPKVIAVALAVPAGIGAFFVIQLVRLLFRDLPLGERIVADAAAIVLGLTSAISLGVLGTTMNEWPGAALTMASLYIVVRALAHSPQAALSRGVLIGAGLLCGLATGAKFTFGVFAVGLCAAIFWRTLLQPAYWRRAFVEAFIFGLAVLAGTAATAGPWMWALWTQFQNPIFPYGNIWIKSPWWGQYEALGRAFGPHSFGEWLMFPFMLTSPPEFYVAEVSYVDARVPVLYGLTLLAGAAWLAQRASAWMRRPRGAVPMEFRSTELWRVLGIFWAVSFLLWTAQYSIYRYLVPLHLLTGALLVGLLRHVVRPAFATVATVMLAVGLVATTKIPDWWRIHLGPKWFDVALPPIEKDALVLLTTDGPMSYILPFFPADAQFLGINNNISDARRKTLMEDAIRRTIREHKGPMYSLTYPAGDGVDTLLARGVLKITETCFLVRTTMRTSPIELCRAVRKPDP